MRKLLKSFVAISFLLAVENSSAGVLQTDWTLLAGGAGGTSSAVADVNPTNSDHFAYIDSTGMTDLSKIGVDQATTGTVLVSKTFNFSKSTKLSVDLNFLSNDGEEYSDFALVQLLNANTSAVLATIYTANTTCDGCRAVPAIGGPGDISAGVSLNPGAAYFDGNFAGLIGGIPYGPSKWITGVGGATGWVTSSFDVSAGAYQLAFIVGNVLDAGLESALLIDNIRSDAGLIESFESTVNVPEPNTISLVFLGVLAAAFAARMKKQIDV